MAIDYDTANTGLFYRLGKLLKYINVHAVHATLDAEKKAIVDPFEAADQTEQASPVYSLYASAKSQQTSLRQSLAGVAARIFGDRLTCLAELSLLAYDPSTFFPALWARMGTDGETLDRSTVTLGTVTAGANNVGDGEVLVTKLLDGYSSPVSGGQVVRGYCANGATNSELAATETMTFTCRIDSDNGASEGSEQFDWQGQAGDAPFGAFEGSGTGPTLAAVGGATIPANGDMESFTSNLPTGWVAVSGTAGTNFMQTTTAGQFYRGTGALKIINVAATATLSLSCAIPATSVNPYRAYCLSFRFKAASVPAAGTLVVQVTDGASSLYGTVSVAFGSMPTTWTLYNVFLTMPLQIPDDLIVKISTTGTLSNGVALYLDDVFLSEVVYHGGIGAVVVPGAIKFAVGDTFTCDVANDAAGLFQEFFRKWAGVQLPSDGAGGETILDSLAT